MLAAFHESQLIEIITSPCLWHLARRVQRGTYTGGEQSDIDLAGDQVGYYQLVRITDINANQLIFEPSLRDVYAAASGNRAQAIRIPEYSSVDVPLGTSVVAEPWNGANGGMVAFLSQGSVTVNGAIDVSAQGFRGGVIVDTATTCPDTATRVIDDPMCTMETGRRGEGIDGTPGLYSPTGATGCGGGNLAQAGGGGGALNAGGGGGGHAGQGGIGGLEQCTMIDMTLDDVGGLGGARVLGDLASHLSFGGGGGSGHADNGFGQSAGAGGGVLWFRGQALLGTTGELRADGASALSSGADGGSGGGAGGAIFAHLEGSAACAIMSASGGDGGDAALAGEGGGGGGGRIWIGTTDNALCPTAVAPGMGGTGGVGFPPPDTGEGEIGQVITGAPL